MNNKEFITHLSEKLNVDNNKIQDYSEALLNLLKEEWQEGNNVTLDGFGAFNVEKVLEKIVTNPTTKQRILIPPKLYLDFKPCKSLKDKLK